MVTSQFVYPFTVLNEYLSCLRQYLATTGEAPENVHDNSLFRQMSSLLPGQEVRVECLRYMVGVSLTIYETLKFVSPEDGVILTSQ